MKYQLVVLAAFIALFGSTRSVPQNAVDVEEAAAEAIDAAGERGASAAQADYQNDNYYYRYGTRYVNGMYYAPYSYITKASYDQKVLELAQCQVERDALLAAANPDLQEEAGGAAAEAEEDKESEEKEEETEEESPMCSAKAEIGPCRSYVPRYFYDEISGSCKMFTYGGCGGNSNNFRTPNECEKSCMPTSTCSQLSNVGYCRGRLPRYYFSTVTGRCELFYYGGCGGNSNNFMTMQECQSTCDSVCALPKDQGPCRGAYARWYHNSETGQCEVFIYGGCGGNANNFRTKDACEAHC